MIGLCVALTVQASAIYGGFQLRGLNSRWWATRSLWAAAIPVASMAIGLLWLIGSELMGSMLFVLAAVFFLGDILRASISGYCLLTIKGANRLFESAA